MKETIRIKLTKDAEKALLILSKLSKTSKKEIIQMVIKDEFQSMLKRFELINIDKSGTSNLDNRRIDSLKKKFNLETLEVKSYAIDPDIKKILKETSKKLNINMGLTLSILLEDQIKFLINEIERKPKVEELLHKLANLKQKIAKDVYEMNDIWYKLRDQYPDEETNSPFYHELMYFFEGFHQFNP